MKRVALSATIALAALLAGCGGGGGGDAPPPPPTPPDVPLALMVDSMGRQVPEAEFGRGDALAAGADGIAFDQAPIANAQVTLTDSGGLASTLTATTDAQGYFRLNIKGLRPPFLVKVKRTDGAELFSAGTSGPVARGFVPINVNGLTDKTLGYVADAINTGGGAASAVTAPMLASNVALLDQAKAKLRTGLSVPLVNAGFDAAGYDPVTTPLVQASADKHADFLRGLAFSRNAAGRVAVIGTVTGTARTISPVAVAADGAGNMYVADDETNSIRKINPAGAGTTLVDFAGLAGGAGSPPWVTAIAVDAEGNLFVADGANYAILKVTPAGVVGTLAGGAGSGFADGTGSAAKFGYPNAIAVDRSGNVYVSDPNNHGLRKITPAGVVTTVAGYTPQNPLRPGLSAVTSPEGVAVNSAGNVYYADNARQAIVKLTPNVSVADVYRAPAGLFFFARSLAVDAVGTIYAPNDGRVVRITPPGAAGILAGGTDYGSADGNGTAARFNRIGGIAIEPSGNLLVLDPMNAAIRRVTPSGDVTTVVGKKAVGFVDGPAASASFSGQWSTLPYAFVGIGGVAVGAAGDIYLADTGNHVVRRIARSGAVTTIAGNGAPGFANGNGRSASFDGPIGVALDAVGNIYVADGNNNAVRKISPSGDVSTLAGSGASGSANGAGSAATFAKPRDIAVGADGTVYVSDGSVHLGDGSDGKLTIRRITAAGVVSTFLSNDALPPVSDRTPTVLGPIAVDAGGTVLVKTYTPLFACDICFPGRAAIGGMLAISRDGVVTQGTNASPPVATKRSLALDRDGDVYELVQAGRDVLKLVRRSLAGVTTDIAIDGVPALFDNEGHIAVDANGNVVVVDATSSAIRIVLP